MIITFEQSKKLVALGYSCDNLTDKQFYNPKGEIVGWVYQGRGYIPVITISKALQWLRDEKGIECAVELSVGAFEDCFGYHGVYFDGYFITSDNFKTYPEAESALLDALIKSEEEKL